MPTTPIQAQIAFKNLLGKSQTDDLKGIVNEKVGISFDVPSFNVMMDNISATVSNAVSDGVAVKVVGTLTEIFGSNQKAYQTFWPATPPTGNDIRLNNQPFEYGKGSLEGISAGDKLTNLISDSFGNDYQAIPKKSSGVVIGPLDDRDWVYQYNSGVFYQSLPSLADVPPATIDVYYYIGSRLSDQSQNTQTNIRVTATGSNTVSETVYFGTYSTPTISTYSTNYLFLVDFHQTNLSSTVSFNVNGIGTTSVIKYTADGPVNLVPGDITGATGGTSGQIYYLIYNNGLFEFYPKNPISDPSKFTNPIDTGFKLGGIDKGTQFEKVSFQDVFKDLLYPDQLGNIISFTVSNNSGLVTSYEVGNSLPRQVYTFSWGLFNSGDFESDTLRIEDVTNVTQSQTFWQPPSATPFTQSTSLSSPKGFAFGATISSNVANIRTFKISAKRKNGTIVSNFLDIPWIWRIYHGSSTYSTLTASQVFSLSSSLATQSVGSWTISGTGYKYIAFPDEVSYNFNMVNFKGFPLAMAGTSSGYSYSNGDLNYLYVTVSNSYGINKQYRVYRSKNEISATVSVNII